MKTVTIQINDDKALKLLEDLEGLNLIQILEQPTLPSEKLSEKFAGALQLNSGQHQAFQQYLDQSRSEWERDIC